MGDNGGKEKSGKGEMEGRREGNRKEVERGRKVWEGGKKIGKRKRKMEREVGKEGKRMVSHLSHHSGAPEL